MNEIPEYVYVHTIYMRLYKWTERFFNRATWLVRLNCPIIMSGGVGEMSIR